MREYKFRGKRINSDEWIYGYGVVIGEHYGRMHGEEREASIFVEYDEASKLNFQLVEVDPKTVGQYTGLQDRNGVDIYEGDILQVKESLSNFVYNHTNGTITSNSWENNFKHVVKFSPSGLQLVSYFVNQHECEVVCDIYTNLELLGEVRE